MAEQYDAERVWYDRFGRRRYGRRPYRGERNWDQGNERFGPQDRYAEWRGPRYGQPARYEEPRWSPYSERRPAYPYPRRGPDYGRYGEEDWRDRQDDRRFKSRDWENRRGWEPDDYSRYDDTGFRDSGDFAGDDNDQDREEAVRRYYARQRQNSYFYPAQATGFWNVPGPFRGYGPAEWVNLDTNIEEEINERLRMFGKLDASNIHVDVNHGEATLTGSVDSRKDKKQAEKIAESVGGISDVHNELVIENNMRPGRAGGTGRNRRGITKKPGPIIKGMEVIGQGGRHVGKVDEVRDGDFLVKRPLGKDVYVPKDRASVEDQQVILDIPGNEISYQNWQNQ